MEYWKWRKGEYEFLMARIMDRTQVFLWIGVLFCTMCLGNDSTIFHKSGSKILIFPEVRGFDGDVVFTAHCGRLLWERLAADGAVLIEGPK